MESTTNYLKHVNIKTELLQYYHFLYKKCSVLENKVYNKRVLMLQSIDTSHLNKILKLKGVLKMKKARRLFVLVLACSMLFSMTAMAKEVGAPVADYELAKPAEITASWFWVDAQGNILGHAFDDYSKDPVTVMPSEIVNAAIGQDKMIGEYMNNAVTGIWAMDEVVPVGQGGGVIVDGNATNLTFSVLKPELSRVYSAKDFAATLNGTVLNVVKVGVPTNFSFDAANVNFYTPGIVAGQNVKVYQYNDDDTWTECNVTEVREDHVVVDVTSAGIIAFIEVPEVSAE